MQKMVIFVRLTEKSVDFIGTGVKRYGFIGTGFGLCDETLKQSR